MARVASIARDPRRLTALRSMAMGGPGRQASQHAARLLNLVERYRQQIRDQLTHATSTSTPPCTSDSRAEMATQGSSGAQDTRALPAGSPEAAYLEAATELKKYKSIVRCYEHHAWSPARHPH
eukprot:1590963-Pyramimonas_sp.AAC.1